MPKTPKTISDTDAKAKPSPAHLSSSQPRADSSLALDHLYTGDCLELVSELEDGTIDLIFADPPFNIGYDYDVYDDRRDAEAYAQLMPRSAH